MNDKVLLFLDGDPNRAAVHCQRLTDADRSRTMWVKTVDETISVLETYRDRLEEVSLEYDLGEEPNAHPSREDCGMQVVRYLEKQSPDKFKHINFVIHTWNASASSKMVNRLLELGLRVVTAPFGTRK